MARSITRLLLALSLLCAPMGCASPASPSSTPLASESADPDLSLSIDLDELTPVQEPSAQAWRQRALDEADSAMVAAEYASRGCAPRDGEHDRDPAVRGLPFTVGTTETEAGRFVVVERRYECDGPAQPRLITVFAADAPEDPASGTWRESYGLLEDVRADRFEFVDVEGGQLVLSEMSLGGPVLAEPDATG